MNEFREYAVKVFEFLKDYGYKKTHDSEEEVCYCGQNNCFWIRNHSYGWQLDCSVETLDGKAYLYWSYQYHDIVDMKKGLLNISVRVKKYFHENNISIKEVFDDVIRNKKKEFYELKEKTQAENEIAMADQCWREENFEEARELYKRHVTRLRPSQRKKLEIIEKRFLRKLQ